MHSQQNTNAGKTTKVIRILRQLFPVQVNIDKNNGECGIFQLFS
jgi:hypothetical protein